MPICHNRDELQVLRGVHDRLIDLVQWITNWLGDRNAASATVNEDQSSAKTQQ